MHSETDALKNFKSGLRCIKLKQMDRIQGRCEKKIGANFSDNVHFALSHISLVCLASKLCLQFVNKNKSTKYKKSYHCFISPFSIIEIFRSGPGTNFLLNKDLSLIPKVSCGLNPDFFIYLLKPEPDLLSEIFKP
jgi:hypothetical protein